MRKLLFMTILFTGFNSYSSEESGEWETVKEFDEKSITNELQQKYAYSNISHNPSFNRGGSDLEFYCVENNQCTNLLYDGQHKLIKFKILKFIPDNSSDEEQVKQVADGGGQAHPAPDTDTPHPKTNAAFDAAKLQEEQDAAKLAAQLSPAPNSPSPHQMEASPAIGSAAKLSAAHAQAKAESERKKKEEEAKQKKEQEDRARETKERAEKARADVQALAQANLKSAGGSTPPAGAGTTPTTTTPVDTAALKQHQSANASAPAGTPTTTTTTTSNNNNENTNSTNTGNNNQKIEANKIKPFQFVLGIFGAIFLYQVYLKYYKTDTEKDENEETPTQEVVS